MMDLSDVLVFYLNQLKIDHVFGVPGGAIEPLYNALARSERNGGVRAVIARHETGAAFMADGYFRETGKLGVCAATTGPGATNLITGVASALENHIPLLIITGQTMMGKFGSGALQDSSCAGIDTVSLFKNITKYSTLISHQDQFEKKIFQALMTALEPPFGPVHISVPLDIFRLRAEKEKLHYSFSDLLRPDRFKVFPSHGEFLRLKECLLSSKKTVFVIGEEARGAVNEILEAAERFKASVVVTPNAKGLIATENPRFKGVLGFGGHKEAKELIFKQETELILAIGSNLSEWTFSGWEEKAHEKYLVHITETQTPLMRSPMARLHVRGEIRSLFSRIGME